VSRPILGLVIELVRSAECTIATNDAQLDNGGWRLILQASELGPGEDLLRLRHHPSNAETAPLRGTIRGLLSIA
jgi:hypothetical protein